MSAFDPNDWLDRFEAAGGGWYVRDGEPSLCYLQGNEAAVTALLVETNRPGRSAAIFALILQRHEAKQLAPTE